MVDVRGDVVFFEHLILHAGERFAHLEQELRAICACPPARLRTPATLRVFFVRAMEKQFWRALLPSLHVVDLPRRKHQVHMGMTHPIRHRANLLMDCPGIVVILHIACEERIEDFAVLLQRQLVRQRKDDFLVAFAIHTLVSVCRMKKLERRIFCPVGKVVSGCHAAAAHGEGRLAVDVLHMGKREITVDALLQNGQNLLGCRFYILASSGRKYPSQIKIGV